jgi:multidrug efflux pump subunit AcrA (membrane-fusion protein)
MRRLLFVGVLIIVGIGGFVVSRGAAPAGPGVTPLVDPLAPQVLVASRADLRSVVVLDGIVRPMQQRPVKARREGTVERILVRAGAMVKHEQALFTLRTAKGKYRVRAPLDGVLTSLGVLKGQRVEIGDEVAVVAPVRFLAEATIEPSLLYRLYAPPVGIQAEIDRGPSPFECPFVSIGADLDGAENPLDAPVLVRCAVPPEVAVFAGVRLRLAIVTAVTTDALVIPLEAVEGSAARGVVTVVASDGTHVRRDVRLGISDGVRIEILDGLTDGDRFLEFPPSTSAALQPAASATP